MPGPETLDWGQVYAKRGEFTHRVGPKAEEIILQSLNGFFSGLKTHQQRAFAREVIYYASVIEFGRVPGELKSKRVGPWGNFITEDPLRSSIQLKLGMAGIKDENALTEVEVAASALRNAYHS